MNMLQLFLVTQNVSFNATLWHFSWITLEPAATKRYIAPQRSDYIIPLSKITDTIIYVPWETEKAFPISW